MTDRLPDSAVVAVDLLGVFLPEIGYCISEVLLRDRFELLREFGGRDGNAGAAGSAFLGDSKSIRLSSDDRRDFCAALAASIAISCNVSVSEWFLCFLGEEILFGELLTEFFMGLNFGLERFASCLSTTMVGTVYLEEIIFCVLVLLLLTTDSVSV